MAEKPTSAWRCLLFLALLISPASPAASDSEPEVVVLEGLRSPGSTRVLWKIAVDFTRGCVGHPGLQGKSCQQLRERVKRVSQGPLTPVSRVSVSEDQVYYRIGWTSGGKTRAPVDVTFEAPRLCRVSADSGVVCEDQALSPVQKLLLELRALKRD